MLYEYNVNRNKLLIIKYRRLKDYCNEIIMQKIYDLMNFSYSIHLAAIIISIISLYLIFFLTNN